MTKGKGRGVFAAKNLKKMDLLVVERALAHAEGGDVNRFSFNEKTEKVMNVSAHTELLK